MSAVTASGMDERVGEADFHFSNDRVCYAPDRCGLETGTAFLLGKVSCRNLETELRQPSSCDLCAEASSSREFSNTNVQATGRLNINKCECHALLCGNYCKGFEAFAMSYHSNLWDRKRDALASGVSSRNIHRSDSNTSSQWTTLSRSRWREIYDMLSGC